MLIGIHCFDKEKMISKANKISFNFMGFQYESLSEDKLKKIFIRKFS